MTVIEIKIKLLESFSRILWEFLEGVEISKVDKYIATITQSDKVTIIIQKIL